jgi:hypothetical protein
MCVCVCVCVCVATSVVSFIADLIYALMSRYNETVILKFNAVRYKCHNINELNYNLY